MRMRIKMRMKEHCWWRSRLALARKGLLSAVLTQAVAVKRPKEGQRQADEATWHALCEFFRNKLNAF